MAACDFDRAPFVVIWETTRACPLACLHCRPDANPRRNPRELTTVEGFRLIDQISAFGPRPPALVLTGGDPMRRPDLVDLVRYAARKHVTVALTPSGTAAATRARLRELKDAGLSRVSVGLDGPDAATHDALRGVRGSYDWTARIIDAALEFDLPLQINTTVSRLTLPFIRAMARRVRELPIELWAVFFLVRPGRGGPLTQVTAEQCEDVLTYLYNLSLTAPFDIRTAEAPQFERVMWQRDREVVGHHIVTSSRARHRSARTVNDGNGFIFIDHLGEICPSGCLPMARGNIRTESLVSTYREDQIFRRLRDADALMGACGRCEFRLMCGGSRARAYATTGSLVASDPLCAYDPGPEVRPALPLR
jgi:radical SAM protein